MSGIEMKVDRRTSPVASHQYHIFFLFVVVIIISLRKVSPIHKSFNHLSIGINIKTMKSICPILSM